MRRSSDSGFSRRRFLTGVTAGVVGLAGCGSDGGEDDDDTEPTDGGPEDTTEGLQLWLHPDSGIETADDGVETWRDDSGNSFDFTQREGEHKPMEVEDAVNGHAALRFDGGDDYFLREDSLGIPDDSARTFVVVSRLTDLAARSPFLMQGTFDTEGGNSNYYGIEANTFNTAGERFGFYVTSVGKDTERSTDMAFNVHVLQTGAFPELADIENSTSYFINGQEMSFESTPGNARNSPFASDATAIGAFPQSDPGSVLHGEIAEIRVYDRSLNDSDRTALEGMLIDKYGLS